jgi:hypothetical protein
MITKRSSLESSNKKQNKFDDLCLPNSRKEIEQQNKVIAVVIK